MKTVLLITVINFIIVGVFVFSQVKAGVPEEVTIEQPFTGQMLGTELVPAATRQELLR